jgi:hypothetical protein
MKRIYFIFLLAIFLASCATGTAVPTVTATTAAIPTLMPPTKVPETSTPVDTATALPPTEVPIPVITKSELANFDWEKSWIDISWADYQKGLDELPPADIAAKVTDSTEPVSFLNQVTQDGSKVIDLRAKVGENLFVTQALRVDLVTGRPFRVLKTWAVYPGPDGHNKLYRLDMTFGGSPETDTLLKNLREFGSTNGSLYITFQLTEPGADGNTDPWVSKIEGMTPERIDFYNGKINKNTKNALLIILRTLRR